MAKRKIPKQVEKAIDRYVGMLKENNLPLKKVILFGSYASGKNNKWSDIDLCIISPKFKNAWQATQYLWSKRTIFDLKYTIEPVGFTPKDFREGGSILTEEIKKTGIEIPVKE